MLCNRRLCVLKCIFDVSMQAGYGATSYTLALLLWFAFDLCAPASLGLPCVCDATTQVRMNKSVGEGGFGSQLESWPPTDPDLCITQKKRLSCGCCTTLVRPLREEERGRKGGRETKTDRKIRGSCAVCRLQSQERKKKGTLRTTSGSEADMVRVIHVADLKKIFV